MFLLVPGTTLNDVTVVDKRPLNIYTGMQPCLLHANGMEKYHLLSVLVMAEHIPRTFITTYHNSTYQEAMHAVRSFIC